VVTYSMSKTLIILPEGSALVGSALETSAGLALGMSTWPSGVTSAPSQWQFFSSAGIRSVTRTSTQ
jgi:hypothetical protein